MALIATSLDGPACSWFFSVSEVYTQDWSTFTLTFLEQFDSVTAQNEALASAENAQFRTHEPNFLSACRVEDPVKKSCPEIFAKKRNKDYVSTFNLGLHFKKTSSLQKEPKS